MLAALASCNLQDAAGAKRYLGMLAGSRLELARQSCLRNGVEIE